MRLAGRVALITGGAGSFGQAITKRLLAEGARVAVTDLDISSIEMNDDIFPLSHDVTSESDWRQVMDSIITRFGKLDILVNNAGRSLAEGPQDPENCSIEHWRAVNGVNAEGTLLGCQAAIRAMKQSGGAIVNISSISALNPSPKMIAYGASKAAVRHMTRTVAAYCTDQGYPIRCNSVHPGWFPTPMVFASRTAEELEEQEKAIPMGRFGVPEDVAAAVAYLCSDDANYMTGAKLVIDGGITME